MMIELWPIFNVVVITACGVPSTVTFTVISATILSWILLATTSNWLVPIPCQPIMCQNCSCCVILLHLGHFSPYNAKDMKNVKYEKWFFTFWIYFQKYCVFTNICKIDLCFFYLVSVSLYWKEAFYIFLFCILDCYYSSSECHGTY